MEYPEDSILVPVSECGMRSIQAGNLGSEAQHISCLDAIDRIRDALGRNDATLLRVQRSLH
jgi:hypothetical protein